MKEERDGKIINSKELTLKNTKIFENVKEEKTGFENKYIQQTWECL